MGLNQFIFGTLLFHLMWNLFTACQFHNKHFLSAYLLWELCYRVQYYLLLSISVTLLKMWSTQPLSPPFTAVWIFSVYACLKKNFFYYNSVSCVIYGALFIQSREVIVYSLKTFELLIKDRVKLDTVQKYVPVLNSNPVTVSSPNCVALIIYYFGIFSWQQHENQIKCY